jgi:hypothetical protein
MPPPTTVQRSRWDGRFNVDRDAALFMFGVEYISEARKMSPTARNNLTDTILFHQLGCFSPLEIFVLPLYAIEQQNLEKNSEILSSRKWNISRK